MYVSKNERLQLVEAKNARLDSIETKLSLILEALNLNTSDVLTEDTEDDIKVEVDGETVVDTTDDVAAETEVAEIADEVIEDNKATDIGPVNGLVQMLMDAIKDEYEAIQFYNDIITFVKDEGEFDEVVRILTHINEEEHIHVGMLQQILTKFDITAKEVETGKDEATEIIEDESTTATDTAIEG